MTRTPNPKNRERSAAVLGYVRVSTADQADSGAGLDAQRAAITAECARRGWDLAGIFEDAGYSAKNLDRPAMSEALRALGAGEASALVVAKLDRATRSVMDAQRLLVRCQHEGWSLVALDLGLDLTTPTGDLIASVMSAVAQWERRAIGARTREALAAKKAQGVRIGRPRTVDPNVAERIRAERAGGSTLWAIANGLNDAGILTPSGRPWSAALVRRVALQTPEGSAA